MKRILYLSAALLLLSCSKKQEDKRISLVDSFLQSQVDHFKFNGNVLIAEKGKIPYQKSFGLADYYTNRPLNDTSLFELASVSKQFTATGILILKDQGKLALSDSLRHYFPELPYSGITLHHMLTHTSGLPDYEAGLDAKWDHTKIAFNKDVIDYLAAEKPAIHFKPNERWEYSNTAYALLASIIEKVSGEPFKDFMKKNVFDPLQMKHSRVYNTRRSGETLDNYAYGFVWSDSLQRYALPDSLPGYDIVYFLDGIQGDGIINSTTGDLLKWDRAVQQQTLLQKTTAKEFSSPHVLVDTLNKGYYGYGVFVGENQFGNYIHHSGGWPGYSTNLARYVEDDKTIIVLSNNESYATALQGAIAFILYNQPVQNAYQHKATTQDTSALELFTGSYTVKNWKFDIVREKDMLFQVFKSGFRRAFQAESATKIFLPNGDDLQFELEKNANSEAKYYRILYGVKEEMTKLK